jgi:predicted regulator of Ras-like GTPase activity (Roadblock/LC7/MglB family)
MDVSEALARLLQDSSQVQRAVVLDRDGSVLGATFEDEGARERLAAAARDLTAAAGELHAVRDDVTRVEVELSEGAVFVLREGGKTIAAVTDPNPTSGLVAYDLRTCLHGIDEAPKPKRRRAAAKLKDESAP